MQQFVGEKDQNAAALKKKMHQFVEKKVQHFVALQSAFSKKRTHTPEAIWPPLSPSHRHTGAHVDIYDK